MRVGRSSAVAVAIALLTVGTAATQGNASGGSANRVAQQSLIGQIGVGTPVQGDFDSYEPATTRDAGPAIGDPLYAELAGT